MLAVKIFIIYAREDSDALLEFKKSLVPLERQGEVEVWYDGEIIAGQEWEKAIKMNLEAAQVIILFLSNDFFNSQYIETVELREALARHERGEVIVVPVVLRHCLWQKYPQIERLQVLPNNAAPVFSKKYWEGPDEAFLSVASGVSRAAHDFVKGISKSPHRAKLWFEKAAKRGDTEAMRNLGGLYYNGQGVTEDYEMAEMWFKVAAEMGNTKAITNLGILYENKIYDKKKASLCFEKAAEKGDAEAMCNLGIIYLQGLDFEKAILWFEKAAEKGDAEAMRNLGALYYNGRGVTKDNEKANVWFKKASLWFEKAAEKGDAEAMNKLGDLYNNGQGVTKDYEKAEVWFEKAERLQEAHAIEPWSIEKYADTGYRYDRW